jgi:hypothetical protein
MADDTHRFAGLYPHPWSLDPSPARANIDNVGYRHSPDPACTCADCHRFRDVKGYPALRQPSTTRVRRFFAKRSSVNFISLARQLLLRRHPPET